MSLVIAFSTIAIGYILGSIPPAYILGKVLHGVDIRKQGSGNVGGANAGRLFGKKVFAAVAIFDVLKGTAAILVASIIVPGNTATTGFFASEELFIGFAGFMAIFGHCYSIWLSFSGGKGGATTAGVMLALDPLSFGLLLVVWIVIVGTTRFTSLGNLLAVLVIPIMLNYQTGETTYFWVGWVIVALIYWRHRANIGRLIRGEERKFGNKEKIQDQPEATNE